MIHIFWNILAGSMLALPFIWPGTFWPLVLIAFSPLMAAVVNSRFSFLSTSIWYSSFMLCHTTALFFSLHPQEQTLALAICLALTCIIIGLQTGLWFFITSCFVQRTQQKIIKIGIVCASLFLFLLFLDRALFWFFGAFQGYGLIHPLLPLLSFFPFITIIATLGEFFSLLLLIVCNLIVSFLYKKSKIYFFMIGVCAVIFGIICYYIPDSNNKHVGPAWLSRVAYAQLSGTTQTAYTTAQEIKRIVLEILEKQPEVESICFPESTFCYSLYHAPLSLMLLTEALPESKKIMLGAHKKNNQNYYSCCIALNNSSIDYCYIKKKLLFFAEELPAGFTYFSCFKKLFLGAGVSFSSADTKQQETFMLLDTLKITPLICSELFLGHKPIHAFDCLLALVNDKRFSYGPFYKLLYQTARLKALLWGKPILYVGYKKHGYIPAY